MILIEDTPKISTVKEEYQCKDGRDESVEAGDSGSRGRPTIPMYPKDDRLLIVYTALM